MSSERGLDKQRLRRWAQALLLSGSIFQAGLAAAFFVDSDTLRLPRPSPVTAIGTDRISPSEVNLSNLDLFEAQLRQDLPVRTPKQEVEAYLTRWNIPHSFADPGIGLGENTFYGTLKNIGVRAGIFMASLAIRIHLDADARVDGIKFRVDYL
jgi:hypothetical protein